MSSAAWVFAGIFWLSIVALVAVRMAVFSPAKRKPLDRDALEATDAALRGRLNDLEDRFDHFVKRQAGRTSAARQEEAAPPAQTVLELTRLARARGLR